MSDMDELIAFLRAQLEVDERVARDVAALAPFDQWDAVGSRVDDEIGRSNWEVVRIARPPMTSAAKSISQHIARWDPARVLAEVEAKRRVLDQIWDSEWGFTVAPSAAEWVIKLLAQPYAGRDGWREEWRA